MSKISTNISIDPILKANAIALFSALGLDLSTAITLFLLQSVREQRIPFEISLNVPNQTTIDAFNELPSMKSDKNSYKRYNDFEEILKEIEYNTKK